MHKQTSRILAYTATEADTHQALIELIHSRNPSYVPEDIAAAIASGAITVDGVAVSPDFILTPGMTVRYAIPERPEPDVDDSYQILYRADDIAVIAKSGNLPSHPAGRYFHNTLTSLLVARDGFREVHLVNRLDRETSGLVLVAESRAAASALGRAMMRGDFDKRYLVAVEGAWHSPGEWHIARGTLTLVRGTVIRKKYVFQEFTGHNSQRTVTAGVSETVPCELCPVHCETHFRPLAFRDGMTLLEAHPVTGRPHQIRATLKSLGFPVVGDKLYGVDETLYVRMTTDALTPADRAALRMPRQALHAWKLRFTWQGVAHEFVAPPPADFPFAYSNSI